MKQCGACSLLDTAYPQTLHMKRKSVMRLFPGQEVQMVRGMENPYHYRHKVYASFRKTREGRLTAGMYEEGSHRLVDSSDCLIQNETANAIIRDFTEIAQSMKLSAFHEDTGYGVLRHLYIRVSHAAGDVLLVIVIGQRELPGSKKLMHELLARHPEIKTIIVNHNRRKTSMILGEENRVIYGKGYIFDEIDGIRFRISPRSFFQVNPVQTEVLYRTALDLAGITDKDRVLDLCCGIGTITLCAARRAKHVTGVEIVPDAIRDAISNASHNRIDNVSFFCSDIRQYLKEQHPDFDLVIADPPRSGLGKGVSQAIGESGIRRMVYISCNPESQADDCRMLKKFGFEIKTIVPVDMFCFTKHVETVCLLTHTG